MSAFSGEMLSYSQEPNTETTESFGRSLEYLDPSLENGFECLRSYELPVEVRSEDNAAGVLELIRIKVMIKRKGSENDGYSQSVRMELSSEADLFFHYVHFVDDNSFPSLQEKQKLMVEFGEYASEVLIRMLESCVNEPHVILGIFTMYSADEAKMEFLQNLEYKFVELFTVQCIRSPETIVQNHITYRYNKLKQILGETQKELTEVTDIVKIKNPSLLLALQKKKSLFHQSTHSSGSNTH